MKLLLIFLVLFFFNPLSAQSVSTSDIQALTQELGLVAGSKASIQWRRVFSSERRLTKYKLDQLSPTILRKLEIYLINHAADSEQPIVPGL